MAIARLLRGVALFGLVIGLLACITVRWVPPMAAVGLFGAIAGAWAGCWTARPLPGRGDWRWLLPAVGLWIGLAASGVSLPALVGPAIGLPVAAVLARSVSRRWHAQQEWDDPAAASLGLAVITLAMVAFGAAQSTMVDGVGGALSAASAIVGGVGAYAAALTIAAPEARDPFADDPRRAVLLLGLALLLGSIALALWSPRLVPLLVLGFLALAAGGRPRTVAALGLGVIAASLYMGQWQPAMLARMFGGWAVAPVLGLVSVMVAVATVVSLLAHQRDRTRARLRVASGHLLTLAEKSPGLVATFDREARHRFVNEAYLKWSRLPRERVEGAPLGDVLGPEAAAALASPMACAMAGASQQAVLTVQDRKLDARLEPYFGLDGAIAGFHLLAEDVTWREQGQRELSAMVNAAPDPTLVLDEGGRIQLYNEAASRLFGTKPQALLGTPLASWLSEGGTEAQDRRSATQGAAGMRGRRPDGSMFPVELRLGSMPGEHGGRAVVSLRDLTAQRALEEAARQAREQAQATLDSISDAVVVCDLQARITGLNPAAVELTGWSAADAVGRPLDEIIRLVEPAKGTPQPSVLRRVLASGKPARLEGERELVRRDGAHRPIEESASPLKDRFGMPIGGVLMFHDVTHVREQAQALSHMAQHDSLTGLPNRVLFQDRLSQALSQLAQDRRGAVLYMDLDKFKPINDTLGHPVGDRVLQEVASRLRACVREDDTVSRQGGDEFVLLLVRLADPRDAARVAEKLIRSIEQPILVDGHELRVGASVGISLFPQDSRDARTLMKQADTALYHVKETGRGRFSYFADVIGAHAEVRMRLEHDLRLALAHDDFVLDYQPVFDSRDGGFRSVEALLRWRQEGGAVAGPETFLSVAEETGLIVQIDEWVLHAACRQSRQWRDAGMPPCPVSVNVSLARFDAARLVGQVRSALAAAGLEPGALELEFRGEQLFRQGEKGRALVADLRALGVHVAVDDVGSGQASVAQLADYGFDALKLDLAFVEGLPHDERARRIAAAICRMAAALGYPVVAKGVESEAHRDLLASWGCAGLQGTLMSPPLGAALVPGLLGQGAPRERRA